MGERVAALTSDLRIRRYFVLGYSVLTEVISWLIHEGTSCYTY